MLSIDNDIDGMFLTWRVARNAGRISGWPQAGDHGDHGQAMVDLFHILQARGHPPWSL
jgi:hypothetical protein